MSNDTIPDTVTLSCRLCGDEFASTDWARNACPECEHKYGRCLRCTLIAPCESCRDYPLASERPFHTSDEPLQPEDWR